MPLQNIYFGWGISTLIILSRDMIIQIKKFEHQWSEVPTDSNKDEASDQNYIFFEMWQVGDTSLSPPVKYLYWPIQGGAFLWIIYVIFVLYLLGFCARLFIDALWSPAGKGLTSCLSFVSSNCEFVTSRLVSWVRCGPWLYRFLIFALSLTLPAWLSS